VSGGLAAFHISVRVIGVPLMCRATVFRGNGAGSAAHYFVGAGMWGTA
jgi:hypothetical protein